MAKKNVIINKVPYEGVAEVKIPLPEGGGDAIARLLAAEKE